MERTDNISTFRADVTTSNNDQGVIPQCIKEYYKEPIYPNRQPLTDDQTLQAKSDLVNDKFVKMDYPKRMKFRVDPPIPGQQVGLISFIPSKNAIPDNDGCFGLLKLRGNFYSEQDADVMSENLIRNVDTYTPIDMVYIGKEFPLFLDNTKYVKETREIDIRKKIEETKKEHLKSKKEEEQKEIAEIEERQKKLLNHNNDDEKEEKGYDDLEFYTQLKVKKASALAMIEECKKKIEEAQLVIDKTEKDILDLDEQNPTFKQEYLQKYTNALKSVGADIADNPLIQHMK
jgi:hypothetical protein